MDNSIGDRHAANGRSIVLENHGREKSSETAGEWVLSTSETVRVNVLPVHLQETSYDKWLHKSTKDITDSISNTIVSRNGTITSLADGQILSFVDIDLKQAEVDDLLTDNHKSKEFFEESSLASERPSSPSSSKSFEVLKWVANQEQSSNKHQLKRLNSLDTEKDGLSIGRIMNKINSQESYFHSSGSFAASQIIHVDNAVQFDNENEIGCAQGQEIEMVNGCNSACNENLRKRSTSTSCLTQPHLKNVLDALEMKFETFYEIIKVELGRPHHPDSPPKWFLEYMEAEKLKQSFESQIFNPKCPFNGDKEEVASTVIRELRHMRQEVSSQATEIRLQNALSELETTRAEMVKVQRKLNRVENELALESSKHAEEISTFEKKDAVKAHALEQTQTEASLLKSSLDVSLAKNESALFHLAKAESQLEEALDCENSLKLELKELQSQLSAVVKEKNEESYKHAEEISSLKEKNAARVHALESELMQLAKTKGQLEEALGRENVFKIELKKLQNELCAVKDEKDKNESRPEATFRYEIHNFEKAKTKIRSSNATMVRNLAWRIALDPKNVENQQFLGFFLRCDGNSSFTSWSCQAKAELRLVSQKEGVESFTRKFPHRFCEESRSLGYNAFMSWIDICNPEKGYIKDNYVILEVHLVADAPLFQ